jgi:predicted ester cyclase
VFAGHFDAKGSLAIEHVWSTGTAQTLHNQCGKGSSSNARQQRHRPAIRSTSDQSGSNRLCREFVWEDVVEQAPLPGQGPGLQGLKDVLRGMRAGFPDLYFAIEEQIAQGDKVLTRFEWTGTHQGEFLGVPATGRPVKVWGMVIDRLQGGRIKDTRILMDSLGLMMQLGVFPSPKA